MNRFPILLVLAIAGVRPGAAVDPIRAQRPAPVSDAEWNARDIEGRWLLLHEDLERDPKQMRLWVEFLSHRKDYRMLEWIAVYKLESIPAREALADANAPQWMRAAVWAHDSPNSHAVESAQLTLLKKRPGAALAWLEEYPEVRQRESVAKSYKALKELAPKKEDVEDLLPPLLPGVVLAHLAPPREVHDFRGRRAKPGRVYVHQVERAIDGLVVSGLLDDKWLDHLAALIGHGHPRMRQKALLAYSFIPSNIVPLDRIERVLDDPKELPHIRSAAALAYSYSSSPRAYQRLHEIAAKPHHPAWRAVVSRITDLGDHFTVALLTSLEKRLPDERRKFSASQRERLSRRLASARRENLHYAIRTTLLRAAWMKVHRSTLAADIQAVALRTIKRNLDAPKVRATLSQIKTGYRAPVADKALASEVQKEVRRLADELLK